MDNVDEKLEIEETDSRIYEIGYHVVPTTAEEEVVPVANNVKDMIESVKGVIIADDNPILINLAYSMNHVTANKKKVFDSAYFGWIKFQADVDVLVKIKEWFEKNEDIFRFIIIKTVKENTLIRKIAIKTRKKSMIGGTVGGIKKGTEIISEKEVDKAIEELVAE